MRELVKELFGQEAVEEIDRYMADRGSNVILVYAENDTFEILGGVVTNSSLDIDSMIDLIGIDMDEFAAWKGWGDWHYYSLIMIYTGRWHYERVIEKVPGLLEKYVTAYIENDKEIYNKAIDDFVKEICK